MRTIFSCCRCGLRLSASLSTTSAARPKSSERFVIDYLRGKTEKLREILPAQLAVNLHSKLDSELEYWRGGDILDLLKGLVDTSLIDRAKQVKRYRDWVAHRNDRKPSPAKVTPPVAYQVLSEIIRQIGVADPGCQETGAQDSVGECA
jgi:hypothetical protein